MNEINMIDLDHVRGGAFSWSEFLGAGAGGGIAAGVSAAPAATTVAALALPIAVGAAALMTAYLVKTAISEGIETAAVVAKHGI